MGYTKLVFFLIFCISNLYAQVDDIKVATLYKEIFSSKKEAEIAKEIWERQSSSIDINLRLENSLYTYEKKAIDDFLNDRITTIVAGARFYYENKDILDKKSKYKLILSRSHEKFEQFYLIKCHNSNLDYKNLKEKIKVYYKSELARYWLETIVNNKNYIEFEKIEKSKKLILNPFFSNNVFSLVEKDLYNSMYELNPQIAKQIDILKKSENIFFRAIAITRNNLSEETYAELAKLYEKINKSKISTKSINFLKASHIFTMKNEEDFNKLEKFFEEYFRLKGVNK